MACHGAIEECVPLQVALAKVVRAMGVKEFAAKVRKVPLSGSCSGSPMPGS
jgi:hypothetical protein